MKILIAVALSLASLAANASEPKWIELASNSSTVVYVDGTSARYLKNGKPRVWAKYTDTKGYKPYTPASADMYVLYDVDCNDESVLDVKGHETKYPNPGSMLHAVMEWSCH